MRQIAVIWNENSVQKKEKSKKRLRITSPYRYAAGFAIAHPCSVCDTLSSVTFLAQARKRADANAFSEGSATDNVGKASSLYEMLIKCFNSLIINIGFIF